MLKQTLLAFTVLGFAGTAAAADITNPFFLPEAMHVASVTSADFLEVRIKPHGEPLSERGYTKSLTEELQFGILNNLALIGGIKKDWTKAKEAHGVGKSEKDKNDLDWEAGLAWNILHCNTKLQLSSVYGQEAPGVGTGMGTYKYFDTELKLGYQFKTFLPYISGSVVTPVGQKSRANRWNYTTKVGVYQGKCGVWGLDTGITVNFDRADHSRYVTADAEASYYLTKNMTLGVYGSYVLDAREKKGTFSDNYVGADIYGKSVGARLRLYF